MGSKIKTPGTAFNLNQFAEMNAAVTRALPGALELAKLDPKVVVPLAMNNTKRFRELLGWALAEVSRQLASENGQAAGTPIPQPHAEQTTITFQIGPEDNAELPDGWKPNKDDWVEDMEGAVTIIFPTVHLDVENKIRGETLFTRSRAIGPRFGLRAAKALVRQQHLIPEELRGKIELVFTGAIADGDHYTSKRSVAIMCWNYGRGDIQWQNLSSAGWLQKRRPVQSGTPAAAGQ